IQVDDLEGDQIVRNAKRIRKGLDAGLLHVTLLAADGDIERIALDPELQVTVVGKDPAARKGKSEGKKAKGKARAKAKSTLEAAAASEALAASSETTPSKSSRGRQKVKAEKKMSCLDAAAKLLTETDQPMTCQELIDTIAAKGYWTSPA